jgi:elongation factor G
MKEYPTEQIRNAVLTGHGSTGKTAFSEAALYASGAINRLGKIDEGTTTSDHDPDEVKRGFSINLSVLPCEWKGHKINLIDTPGYADFIGEVKAGVRAADLAILVVCAASGVQVGTESALGFIAERDLPIIVFVNRMDRENADFNGTLSQLQNVLGKKCVPAQVPIGAQDSFEGVVDLVTMKAYTGEKAAEAEVPDSLAETVARHREQLVEAVAETDDDLINKYLEGGELSEEEVRRGLRAGVISRSIIPVFNGSATKTIAVGLLLDALVGCAPSPKDIGEVAAQQGPSGPEQMLAVDQGGPLAALAFKTAADPYVGKLTYLRVFTGTLQSDSQVLNANKGSTERIGQLFMVRGKGQEQVSRLVAGDIGAVPKLSDTATGDTLCQREKPLLLAPVAFPEPCYSAAVRPKSKADLDKMGSALSRIAEEDPTLRVHREHDTAETILSGLGDSHLDVAAEKMRRKFGVDLELTPPKVPYKETITASGSSEYTHKKQTGGHGQYARVSINLEPLPRGSGFEFVDRIVGGVVPKTYIPAVEKGVLEAMQEGVLAHYPLIDLRATLFDGKDHPVDSSEIAFKIAGAAALKKGAQDTSPVLLEPIVNLTITVPEANTGDIMSDLNGKRAKVLGMTPEGSNNVIEAQAPLAEVLRYATDLRSITQGRGSYRVQFSHYEEVPAHVAQRIVEQARKEKESS